MSETNNVTMEKSNSEKNANSNTKSWFSDLSSGFIGLLEGQKRLLAFFGIWSIVLNLFLEASLRKSFMGGISHIFVQPLSFLFNSLIIFATFSIILLVRRRVFSFTLISILWIAMAVVNTILLAKRNTPFNGSDFRLLFSVFEIIENYLTIFQMILVIVLIISAISLIVVMYIKGKRSDRNMHFSGVSFSIIMGITVGAVLIHSLFVESTHFSNLPKAYREYGFVYSFLCSSVDHGIDKPQGYDDSLVRTVLNGIEDEANNSADNNITEELSDDNNAGIMPATISKPNVIFLQLESFYDPANVKNISFNKDPVPIFRGLMKNNMSGAFTVPSIGAGTANTEFEVLTGMDIDHFGIAEYPYLSVLQNSTCESVAYNFKEAGYATHILHNNIGTFYDRNIVFPNLGFDTFVSIENMGPVTRNETGWAKDSMLVEEIMGVMSYTPSKADLVYAISVQPHGKYPETEEEFRSLYNENHPAPITVSGNESDPHKYGFDYWVNQVYDVDLFIGDLVSTLAYFDEPTILVMFGDHLPSFEVESWDIGERTCYETEYVIWSNFGLENKGDRSLYTFQIASYIMDMIGIENGYMNMLHQNMFDEGEEYGEVSRYNDEMLILQYDMLYGEKYAYGGKPVYLPTNIRLGYKDIVIEDVMIQGDTLYVYGEGFNDKYSHIYINGSKKITTYLKEGCVTAENVMLNDGDVIKVVQAPIDRVAMNESNHWVYNSPKN